MKHTPFSGQNVRLLRATGGVVLALSAASFTQAQTPTVHTRLTRASMHPVSAQVDPPTPPEPPVPGQGSTPEIKDDLFAGTEKFAKGASDVTEVNMDPNSLDLVHGPDAHRAHRMVLNVVHTYTYDKPGMYNPADVDEFRHRIETGDWHCSIHTRDMRSGESTDICSKRRGTDMMERAIITTAPKSLTFIHSIRRIDEGSKLEVGSFPGTWINPGSAFAMGPAEASRLQAELLASTASVRAELSQVQRSEAEVDGQRERINEQMQEFERKVKPELEQQLKHLNEQLQQIKPNVQAHP